MFCLTWYKVEKTVECGYLPVFFWTFVFHTKIKMCLLSHVLFLNILKMFVMLSMKILRKFIFLNCFWFFILTKPWLEEHNIKAFAKNFFETFWSFPANKKGVKWKLPFWQHFFKRLYIWPEDNSAKNIFCMIYKYTQVFPKKFLVMWDKNWAIQKGSLGMVFFWVVKY